MPASVFAADPPSRERAEYEADWRRRNRVSAPAARDLFRKALAAVERDDADAIEKLVRACHMYDRAVGGDPSDLELFVERCRAWRILAEKRAVFEEISGDRAWRWLVKRQNASGKWEFQEPDDSAQSAHSDDDPSDLLATSAALLSFLGAGKTHRQGEYRAEFRAGLYYLVSEARLDGKRMDLRGPDGNTLAHVLATMALCEAYALSKDDSLRLPAQAAVQFLELQQNQETGGWKIASDAKEDIVTTAWCVMAMQSAWRADLDVDVATKQRIVRFLDSVQSEDGAFYGLEKSGKDPAATAAGLLCRSLLGWTNEHPAMQKGVAYLADPGKFNNDAVAQFFATQTVFHYGGKTWQNWNRVVRDRLVECQATADNDDGSWLFPNDIDDRCRSRTWHTTMSMLTLEVYYRYLTVFKTPALRGLVEIDLPSTQSEQ